MCFIYNPLAPQFAPRLMSLVIDSPRCVRITWEPPQYPGGEPLSYEVCIPPFKCYKLRTRLDHLTIYAYSEAQTLKYKIPVRTSQRVLPFSALLILFYFNIKFC